MTIVLIHDCIKDNYGLYFEIEAEFNYNIAKKLQYDDIMNEFNDIYNSVLTTIDCAKSSSLKIELRYDISNKVITLERNDIAKLQNSRYSVTEKADGERCFIYITDKGDITRINPNEIIKSFVPLCKKSKINKIYYNTLLDGEMVMIDGKIVFLGFDLLFYNNEDKRNCNLLERLKCLELVINALDQLKFGFIFRMKKFYTTDIFKNSKIIWNNRKKLFKYNLDGLIYTPIYGAYISNIPILKWKDKHSIDIRILYNERYDFTEFHPNAFPYTRKGEVSPNNEYKVNTNNGEKIFYKQKITINNNIFKKLNLVNNFGVLGIQGLLRDDKGKIIKNMEEIIEMEYDLQKEKWVFLRKRLDKVKPNAYKTIISVLDAISGNIDIEEISKLKYIPSPYSKIETKIGLNLTSSNISSNICDFYTYMYERLFKNYKKSDSIIILGCNMCLLKAVKNTYNKLS